MKNELTAKIMSISELTADCCWFLRGGTTNSTSCGIEIRWEMSGAFEIDAPTPLITLLSVETVKFNVKRWSILDVWSTDASSTGIQLNNVFIDKNNNIIDFIAISKLIIKIPCDSKDYIHWNEEMKLQLLTFEVDWNLANKTIKIIVTLGSLRIRQLSDINQMRHIQPHGT